MPIERVGYRATCDGDDCQRNGHRKTEEQTSYDQIDMMLYLRGEGWTGTSDGKVFCQECSKEKEKEE